MTRNQLHIGRRVVSNREFSGIPTGTPGEVVARSNSWPDTDSVAIQWNRKEGDNLTDWFSMDELEYLDVPHREYLGGLPLHTVNSEGVCIDCGEKMMARKAEI